MIPQHRKALLSGVVILAAGWTLAVGGYTLAGRARMTVEKIRRYVESKDIRALNDDERQRAVDGLAQKLNLLSPEDQHLARLECPWSRWFPVMSARDKAGVVEETLPADIQNTITAFDLIPEDLQSRALEEALKRLQSDQAAVKGKRELPAFRDQARQTLLQLGLKNYFTTSTAQEKVELAPLLEELHQMMESGSLLRGRQRF